MSRVISVDELTRVEGHGRIRVEIADGTIENLELNIFEGPRFFEAVVEGRKFDQIPSIVCRICAICSAGHKITSIIAVEDAFNVKVSEQTRLLRELLYHGMFIESHVLHAYFLAAPDLLGAPSAIALNDEYPEVVASALRLKKLGNQIQEVVGGRAIHSENPVIGGFGKVPDKEELLTLKKGLEDNFQDLIDGVALFAKLDYPDHVNDPTLFYAVEPEGDQFGYFGRTIVSSDGKRIDAVDYRQVCDERVVDHSTAKHSLPGGKSFMTGALARINLFADALPPKTKSVLEESGWKVPSNNIVHNNLAQMIETVYSFERSLEIIDRLLDMGPKPEKPVEVKPVAGRGVGLTEVPRGILVHDYEFDDEGKLVKSNIVTPTAQNLANIERDIRLCVTRLMDKAADDEIAHNLEIIARAYDPCISCSTHLVEVVFKDRKHK